jgi:hypothetical protein
VTKLAHDKTVDVVRRVYSEKVGILRETTFGEMPAEDVERLASTDPGPDEFAIRNELWERLIRQARCPRDRRILQLRRLGYSCCDIGRQVGLDQSVVRRIISQYKQKFA